MTAENRDDVSYTLLTLKDEYVKASLRINRKSEYLVIENKNVENLHVNDGEEVKIVKDIVVIIRKNRTFRSR